jgi:hypothetical protein
MMPEEPTAAQLAARADVARQTAKVMLQFQQEQMLKTIFSAAQLKQLDKWIADQNDPAIDRPEAIRRLVELGLRAKK